jgi:hypothetical protein
MLFALLATTTAFATVSPSLGVTLTLPPLVEPGLPFDVTVRVFNRATSTESGVVMTLTLPADTRLVKAPDNCSETGGRVTCALGDVGSASVSPVAPLQFTVVPPDERPGGATLGFSADVTGREPDGTLQNNHVTATATEYLLFVVDSASDAGAQLSLAIQDANRTCSEAVPCKIAFRIAGEPEAGGFFRIRPLTTLPAITARNVVIDGSTQTRYVGDTNPDGPEIFIDGSLLPPDANGLTMTSLCSEEVSSLAIGNFGGAGILVGGPADNRCGAGTAFFRTIRDNYIGVDPSGAKAAPNGRGIVFDDPSPITFNVTGNVVSGNRRSGIAYSRGHYTNIWQNKIGLDAKGNPLANGASGIYVGADTSDIDIRGNFIAFNHDFGVAIDRRSIGTDVAPNAIYANWQLGIDIGLDGPTPAATGTPTVLSAQYDPATDTTLITTAFVARNTFQGPVLNFYAADAPHASAYGDGQYYLGTLVRVDQPLDRPVTFPAKGDWRGKWVCVTETSNQIYGLALFGATPASEYPSTHSTTSEFSRAVPVQ